MQIWPEKALIHDGETTYLARVLSNPSGAPMASAGAQLIQGICDRWPDNARTILRHRIHTTSAPSAALTGLVKVAAKRIDFSVDPDDPVLKPRNQLIAVEYRFAETHLALPEIECRQPAGWMAMARGIAGEIHRTGPRFSLDRPIGAVLISAQGDVLAAAANSNSRNRTQHAEMNLLHSYHAKFGGPLPEGASLFVTLKPCKMCAGMIHDYSHPSVKIWFDQDDPGPRARMTALDRAPLRQFRFV